MGTPMIFRAATRFDDYVLEDVIDAYVDWREQSQAVWLAYQRWLTASRADAPLQFAAYLAELDQEERASAVYAATIDRTVEQL
jgi:NAD-dependent SIR2 family protein deacetylase